MKLPVKKIISCAALALGALSAFAADPIKIGSILSVTGPAAFLGDPELKTMQLYVEKINKAGGVLGRPLELVHYDDGSDASKANGFAKRLIESDKIDVLVGGTSTGSTMSIVPLVEKAGMPFISLAGAVVIGVFSLFQMGRLNGSTQDIYGQPPEQHDRDRMIDLGDAGRADRAIRAQ